MSKVVLGFSGGVDSAVCSVLLKKAGYDVIGLYLDNSSEEAKRDAVVTADFVGIPLEIKDVKNDLEEKVCSYFQSSYLKGETPNPCTVCNPLIKFKNLIDFADNCGAEYISTGHYARCEDGALYKGNPENDQSYMLCRLLPEQVKRLVLPLGTFAKSHVRELAREFDLPVSGKPDSMEICFIPDKDYIGWLKKRCTLPPPGDLILDGRVIGTHKGIYTYTVGQRYSGLIDNKKVYISSIDASSNTVTLSFWDDLFTHTVNACNFNYLLPMPDEFDATVRVRHTKWEEPKCKVKKSGDGVEITCEDTVRAPAKGQSAVLYQGERVIGGGFII